MIEFLRAFIRPYIAFVVISGIVALAILLVIKFADPDLAKQVVTFILACGATVIGFYFGERAAKK